MRLKNVIGSLLVVLLLVTALPFAAAQEDPNAEQAIALAAAHPEFADFLADYPGWEAYSEHDDGDLWWVEFFVESEEEEDWLGWALVNVPQAEVIEYFVPRPLSPEEFSTMQPKVKAFVENDPEVLALLGDPNDWESWIDHDRYEQAWIAGYYRGLDAWEVIVRVEEDALYIGEIFNPHVLEEAEAREQARHAAIMLAVEADGTWEALEAYDDWTAYAE